MNVYSLMSSDTHICPHNLHTYQDMTFCHLQKPLPVPLFPGPATSHLCHDTKD